MASIQHLKGSDGSGNASTATVQSTRSALASTIVVDTVAGINADGFSGSMGTPHVFVDPVTAETIVVISEATAVDFTGHVDGSNLEIDTIAPGYTDNGSAIGDIVIIRPTTQWSDTLAEVLEVAHRDDGTLKPAVIYDSNGNEEIKFTATASAVNEVTFANAATGNGPTMSATGGDTNIDLNLAPKGTGALKVGGNTFTHGAWTSFTPALNNFTTTDATITGSYQITGKKLKGEVYILCGASTAFGTAMSIDPPVAHNTKYNSGRFKIIGSCILHDTAASAYNGVLAFDPPTASGKIIVLAVGAGGTYTTVATTSSTVPFTVANGDTLSFEFEYELA